MESRREDQQDYCGLSILSDKSAALLNDQNAWVPTTRPWYLDYLLPPVQTDIICFITSKILRPPRSTEPPPFRARDRTERDKLRALLKEKKEKIRQETRDPTTEEEEEMSDLEKRIQALATGKTAASSGKSLKSSSTGDTSSTISEGS
jgi:hypothetical protein